jgi:hypothetical protein
MPWHCQNRVQYRTFYVDKLCRRVYFTEDEEPPVIQWKNKQYIEKIMFVACVGRPIKSSQLGEVRLDNDWYWDGKVSFHLLVELGNISRRGPNVGNPCVKPVSVSKLVFEEFLCDKVLHDIAHVGPDGQRDSAQD